MPQPDPKRVAEAFMVHQRTKTAGEVIFKKDRSGDASSWAYADAPPSQREIPRDFLYSPENQKPLAKVLRASLAALGHTLLAYNDFARLKSSRLSPDGSLGGRGYIQKVIDMRKQYMNCVEALSALSDTLYDELNAPHWALVSRQEDDEERAEVEAIINDSKFIQESPEDWARQEMEEEFGKEDEDDEDEDDDEDEVESEDDEVLVLESGFGEEVASGDNEEEEPVWMSPPAFLGKRASSRRRKTARDIRLELAVSRVAHSWLDNQENH